MPILTIAIKMMKKQGDETTELTIALTDIQLELASKNDEIDELKREIQELRSDGENTSLQQQLDQSTQEKEKLESGIHEMESSSTLHENELISKLQSDNTSLQQQLDQSTQEKTSLQQQLDQSTQEKTSLQQQLDQFTEEKTSLQQQLDQSTEEKTSLQQQLDQFTEEKTSLQQQLDQFTEERSFLE